VILGLYSLPAAMVNSSLDYLNKLIALFYRENLTKNLQDKYLTGMSFYQVNIIYLFALIYYN